MSNFEWDPPRSYDAEHRAIEAEWERHREDLEDRQREDRLFRTDWKPVRAVKRKDAPRPDLMWRERVFERDQGCVYHENPSSCEPPFQAHHVLTQSYLRKRGLVDALWDPRIGITLCTGAHRRHTLAVERIPYERIPAVVVEYVDSLGLGWMIDRYYPRLGAPGGTRAIGGVVLIEPGAPNTTEEAA